MFTETLLVILLLWGQDEVKSVRIIEMRAPAHAREGDTALLSCHYDPEGDELYSIKWYKEDDEFYRYVPKQPNSTLYFPRPGVIVDMARSMSTSVVLQNLTRKSEGNYTCEVSGEAPNFATSRSSKTINIYLIPDSGPHVTGLKDQYKLDDFAVINCTSSGSRPAAELFWLVNEQPASPEDVQEPWKRASADRPDAEETTLQLRFKVAPRHFVGSSMKLKVCAWPPTRLMLSECLRSTLERAYPEGTDSLVWIKGKTRLKCRATIAPLYQSETNSTHYIDLGLPITRIAEGSPLEVKSPSDPNISTSITKCTKAWFLLIPLILLQIL